MDASKFEGSGVNNMFASEFVHDMQVNTRCSANYVYSLNRVGMSNVTFNAENGTAREFIEFVNELQLELNCNDIAVVFCNAWNTIHTIYIICSE